MGLKTLDAMLPIITCVSLLTQSFAAFHAGAAFLHAKYAFWGLEFIPPPGSFKMITSALCLNLCFCREGKRLFLLVPGSVIGPGLAQDGQSNFRKHESLACATALPAH